MCSDSGDMSISWVKLELGHRAQVRKKPTVEGFTHDWMVFVRGPEHSNIQHFVEKVVFHLHESFPKPKRGTECVWLVSGSWSSGAVVCFSRLHLALTCGRGKTPPVSR
uniref:YEATS domain-containing protein n=1 Tax=Salarias fasciatus TaxID=181472 RepID=A0A672F2P7_SALFA